MPDDGEESDGDLEKPLLDKEDPKDKNISKDEV